MKDLFKAGLNLDLVYPPFLERLLELKARCAARGANYLSTCLLRTVEESDILHQIYLAGGPRAAAGGQSSHNFGLASDEALIVKPAPGRVVRWGSADFDVLGEEAALLGLHWGVSYGDKPHISWPGFVSGQELVPLLRLWQANIQDNTLPGAPLPRLKKVWDYVTANSPVLSPFTRIQP